MSGSDAGTCLLTTHGAAICDRWGANRVSDYTIGNITQFQCVRCGRLHTEYLDGKAM